MIIQILDDEIYNELNLTNVIEYVNLPNIHIISTNSFDFLDRINCKVQISNFGLMLNKAMV